MLCNFKTTPEVFFFPIEEITRYCKENEHAYPYLNKSC